MPRLVALLASFAMAGSALLVLASPADAYVGPISNSWYVTAADLASSGGGIYSSGYNAPSGPQVVFLQAQPVALHGTEHLLDPPAQPIEAHDLLGGGEFVSFPGNRQRLRDAER